MKLKDEAGWNKGLENNQDDYGRAVFMFAEDWANAMEAEMAVGLKLEDCAERLSKICSKRRGLSGYQYNCAVAMLTQAWEHGEELRRWHNLREQLTDEGERANERPGAVLNSCLLKVG